MNLPEHAELYQVLLYSDPKVTFREKTAAILESPCLARKTAAIDSMLEYSDATASGLLRSRPNWNCFLVTGGPQRDRYGWIVTG